MTHTIIDGYATPDGTLRFRANSVAKGIPVNHFRSFIDLMFSSIGMGTYLGEMTNEEDDRIENAIYNSVKSGAINVLDTAINYRAMLSERNVGRALKRLIDDDLISRDQVFISTKNGYITNDGNYPMIDVMEYIQRMYISTNIIDAGDIRTGYNILNPNYISRCIEKSLLNMSLGTIDLVYVHNSYESWHDDISFEEFKEKLSKVFQVYETYRSREKLRYYGMATWTCFRVIQNNKEYLSLEEIIKIAEQVGGKDHGFKFIQLPYNLVYSEALFLKNQSVGSEKNLTILEACEKLNIGVFTSVPLFQSRLLRTNVPDYLGITDQITKLLQIIRSTPHVLAPIIGQKRPEHVRENMNISKFPPLTTSEFREAVEILMK